MAASARVGRPADHGHRLRARSAMRPRRAGTRRGDVPMSFRLGDRFVEAGVIFLLVFTPLAFGTVEPWSEAIAELVVLGMVVVWLLEMMLRDWELRVELPPGWVPASLFVALIFLQATPIPSALTLAISPWTNGFYDQARTY